MLHETLYIYLIAPRKTLTREDVAAVIRYQSYGSNLLVVVTLNLNLLEPEGTLRLEAIADDLASVWLMDIGPHFLPQRKPWLKERCTWIICRYNQEVRSQMEYILGTDHRLFQEVTVWYT